jgi:diguanylate cyclase (GGDEF)-like protein/PAS domain S-box-containing protein
MAILRHQVLSLNTVIKEKSDRLAFFENTYEDSLDMMIQIDPADKRIIGANRRVLHTLGYTEEELIGKEFSLIVEADNDSGEGEIGDNSISSSQLKTKSGEIISIETSFRMFDLNGKLAIWVTFRDITEKKQAQLEVKNQKAFYEFILDNIDSDISVLNDQKQYEYANRVMFSHPEFKNWIKSKTDMELARKANLPEDVARIRTNFLDRALKENQIVEFEELISHGTQLKRYLLRKYIPIHDEYSNQKRIISYGIDITERKRSEERIGYLAFYDSLTGLSNRTLFSDHSNQALRNHKSGDKFIAIYFFDIDNFKFINDTLGHTKGDTLLQMVAARLQKFKEDVDTIARFGGDEFGILRVNVQDQDDAAQFALNIFKVLNQPFRIADREIFTSISMGIAISPTDGDSTSQLLKCADMAMYKAKEVGRNTFKFYTEELNQRSEKRLTLESALRKALQNKEFQLFFQPQIRLHTGKVSGAEALIRWKHPDKGWVSPVDFIPIAEDSGLIESIGDWVLEEACRIKKEIRNQYKEDWLLSVNVSGKQLARTNWAQRVELTIKNSGVDPREMEIELTESSIMENPERSIESFQYLSTLGIKISIDDFGTGYSSLSYLKKIDADYLKIDRSFIIDIEENEDDRAICRAIINMAVSLDMEVIAEGVENEKQRDILKSLGCHVIQGYFYSKPIPSDQFLAFLLGQNV